MVLLYDFCQILSYFQTEIIGHKMSQKLANLLVIYIFVTGNNILNFIVSLGYNIIRPTKGTN